MGRLKALLLSALLTIVSSSTSRADVIITLEPFLENGQPVSGPVAAGTDVVVDLLLSVDGEDNPLADVRLIQFDFESSDSTIELVSFTWTVDTEGYSFQDPDLPLTNVTSLALGSSAQLLTLTSAPVKVASMNIVVHAPGTLDSVSAEHAEGDFGAEIRAGFTGHGNFGPEHSNLQGGTFDFSVPGSGGGDGGGGGGGSPPDTDGDGVDDDDDAFPEDPDETTDTNDDGVGNNEDPDDDSDGVEDGDDDFPVDPDESEDTDGNGVGNNSDPDDDGDGVDDDEDSAPLDPSEGGQANDNTNNQGGGPRACGAGLIGPAIFMFLGLGLLSCRPRRGI